MPRPGLLCSGLELLLAGTTSTATTRGRLRGLGHGQSAVIVGRYNQRRVTAFQAFRFVVRIRVRLWEQGGGKLRKGTSLGAIR